MPEKLSGGTEKLNNQPIAASRELPTAIPDKNFEQAGLAGGERPAESGGGQKAANAANFALSEAPQQKAADARTLAVESVLAQGLEEAYKALPPDKKLEFKRVGEETARQISQLMSEANFKISKIINLIKSWLKLLPGINNFFLEQEAKIKTDAIIQLKKGGE